MLEEQLTRLGMTTNEARIYLTLLKFGQLPTSSLSQKTGIHRTYIYDILDKLKEKGLVSEFKEKNIRYFLATDAKKLREYMEEKIEMVDSILPSLKEIQKESNEDLKVEVYKGLEGVKTILSDIVNQKKTFYAIGTSFKIEEELPYYIKKILREYNELNIDSYVIQPKGEEITPTKHGHYRELPPEFIAMQNMVIYSNRTAFLIWNPTPVQILITSEEVAQGRKKQFEILWDVAKEKSPSQHKKSITKK